VTAPIPKTPPPHRDSRETILGVAGEIFSEKGYEAATIKEITDRAGVNVASVNYYFRDKLGLYTEVLRMGLHNGRLALPPDSAGWPPEERLTRYIEDFMHSLLAVGRPSWCGRMMIRELAKPTPALPQIVEEIIRPNFEIMSQLVAGVAGAPLDDETLRLLTHSVVAQCCHWKTSRPIFPYLWPDLEFDEKTMQRIARQIAAFAIAGIRAAAAMGVTVQ
jgi:TetR/AcrR family transcriptional regulator, regulator of cefoperazone and chloramphenicol sensitivity